jgi:hypothetical protein
MREILLETLTLFYVTNRNRSSLFSKLAATTFAVDQPRWTGRRDLPGLTAILDVDSVNTMRDHRQTQWAAKS